jgi:hypothetical protein
MHTARVVHGEIHLVSHARREDSFRFDPARIFLTSASQVPFRHWKLPEALNMYDSTASSEAYGSQMHSKPTGGPFEVKHMTEFASNGDDLSLRGLRRKADWRISPLTFLCYLMNLIDKVAYNYAGAMGMKEDLHLKGNEFTNVATAFFVAYLVAELPMSEHLEREDSKVCRAQADCCTQAIS